MAGERSQPEMDHNMRWLRASNGSWSEFGQGQRSITTGDELHPGIDHSQR